MKTAAITIKSHFLVDVPVTIFKDSRGRVAIKKTLAHILDNSYDRQIIPIDIENFGYSSAKNCYKSLNLAINKYGYSDYITCILNRKNVYLIKNCLLRGE